MAEETKNGRARLVGVSCKCEIGSVTAMGAGTAKIPGVSAVTALGEVRGVGRPFTSVPDGKRADVPFCCGTSLVLRVDDSSIVMGNDRLFQHKDPLQYELTLDRSEGEKSLLWGGHIAVGCCGTQSGDFPLLDGTTFRYSFFKALPEYHDQSTRQLALLIRDWAAAEFPKIDQSWADLGPSNDPFVTYVFAGFTRDGSPEAFSVKVHVEPGTKRIFVPAVIDMSERLRGGDQYAVGQTDAIKAILDHPQPERSLFAQRVSAYYDLLVARCAER